MFFLLRRCALLLLTFLVLSATSVTSTNGERTLVRPVPSNRTVTVIFMVDPDLLDRSVVQVVGTREEVANVTLRLVDHPEVPPFQGALQNVHAYCAEETPTCRVRIRVEGPADNYSLRAELAGHGYGGFPPFRGRPVPVGESTYLAIETPPDFRTPLKVGNPATTEAQNARDQGK